MNSLIPICINCKYFLKEPTGQHRLTSACAISAIDPVTGEPTGKAKHAGQYRKDVGLCGPVGKYFQPGKKTVLKKEVPKPEVKTIEVEVPDLGGYKGSLAEADAKETEQQKEPGLLPKEPGQKRRRRSK